MTLPWKCLTIFVMFGGTAVGSGGKFKSRAMAGSIWAPFVHTTIEMPSPMASTLCSCLCKERGSSKCSMFYVDQIQKQCHLGSLDNTDTTFLSPPDGDQDVFFDTSVSHALLSLEYYILSEIMDKTEWERFIFKAITLEGDEGACSMKCKQESSPTCDIFALDSGLCYLGNSGLTSGSVGGTLSNFTVYLHKNSASDFINGFDIKSGQMSEIWPHHSLISKTGTPDALTCRANCRMEGQCQFYILDDPAQTCHIGQPSTEGGSQSMTFSNPSEMGVNVIGVNKASLMDLTIQRTTRKAFYHKFSFDRYPDTDEAGCMLLCRFDPLQRCDFFVPINFTHGDNQILIDCILGDFEGTHERSDVLEYNKHFEARIFKDAIGNPNASHFTRTAPTTFDGWKSNTVLTFEVTSELMCSQHTALFHSPTSGFGTFYKMIGETECNIGSVSRTAPIVNVSNASDEVVLYNHAMSTISINHFKPFEPFEDDLIRKYLYHSYPLTADGTVDLYSCFASCKLDVNSCMVVVVHDDICYLGNFEQDNRGIISTALFEEVYVNAGDGALLRTYQDQNRFNANTKVYEEFAKFVYRDSGLVYDAHQCSLICYNDPICDLAVMSLERHCLLADLENTTPLAGVTLVEQFAFIRTTITPAGTAQYFDAVVGDVSQANGFMGAIFWKWSVVTYGIKTEEVCKMQCIVNYGAWCRMVYMRSSDSRCHFGSLSSTRQTGLIYVGGEATDSTEYWIRNDVDYAKVMSEAIDDVGAECASCNCSNAGFHQLANPGDRVDFASGNYPENYGDNEQCYWSIYAWGASQIKVVIENAQMEYEEDGLTYYIGLTPTSPYFEEAGETIFYAVETRIFDTEIMVVGWSSNAGNSSVGLSGYIERIG